MGSQWLVRARHNGKSFVQQVLGDGSTLVRVAVADLRNPSRKQGFVFVRKIVGRVRRPGGAWVTVRLWTSLLDARAYPAAEVLALYARRWDIEVFTKELKVDLRGGTTLLQSHTVASAAQEILALVLAMALLSQVRLAAAAQGKWRRCGSVSGRRWPWCARSGGWWRWGKGFCRKTKCGRWWRGRWSRLPRSACHRAGRAAASAGGGSPCQAGRA